MPGTLKLEKLTTAPGSDLRQLQIQYNNLAADMASLMQSLTTSTLLAFYGPGPNTGTVPFAIGSTTSRVGTAALIGNILGVPFTKAVDDAGTAFGSLGTIPTGTWGLIAFDVVAAGTVTYASAAASYTTGYASEALAIAAMPARITVKARIGYITILAATPGFVTGTDAMSTATTVNYYPATGSAGPTGEAFGPNGLRTAGVAATGSAWSGGKNGVQVATTLAIGSTDTRASYTAFIYNCAGMGNIPIAADTVGSAFGTILTIPADKWGLIAFFVNGAKAISFVASPGSSTGFVTSADAQADLWNIVPAANKCMFGYITIKTMAATAWIAGTDALAGGSTGNEASATNYFPTPSSTVGNGMTASLIASRSGAVVTSANY